MTRNIYEKVRPSLCSLLMNSSVDKVFILAENDDVGFKLPDKVQIVNVLGQTFFYEDGPNYNNRWTYMVMMRTALCHVFPDVDRILSLDLDTIVDENIDDIWDTPLDDFYFAGCPEPNKSAFGTYVNGGVILWNLKKMRDGKADEIIHELNTRRHAYSEQDVMNDLCRDKIYKLSSVYNCCNYTMPCSNPRIYHYAATAGWYQFDPLMQKYKKLWEEMYG